MVHIIGSDEGRRRAQPVPAAPRLAALECLMHVCAEHGVARARARDVELVDEVVGALKEAVAWLELGDLVLSERAGRLLDRGGR